MLPPPPATLSKVAPSAGEGTMLCRELPLRAAMAALGWTPKDVAVVVAVVVVVAVLDVMLLLPADTKEGV